MKFYRQFTKSLVIASSFITPLIVIYVSARTKRIEGRFCDHGRRSIDALANIVASQAELMELGIKEMTISIGAAMERIRGMECRRRHNSLENCSECASSLALRHRCSLDLLPPSSPTPYSHTGNLAAADIMNCCKVLTEMEFRNYHLSDTEKSIAMCILASDTNSSIAKKLYLSDSTIKYHIRNIYKKTKCNDRNTFIKLILSGISNSKHTWHDRVDIDRDMARFQLA